MYEAEKVIATSRKNLQEMINWHELWLTTKGKQGVRCFNYDEIKQQMAMSDAEIIQYFVNKGYKINNAEKYLTDKKGD